jgi:uncharacterized protein YggE
LRREDGGVPDAVVELGLREIVAVRVALESLEAALVARARAQGATWSELAPLLGLSKQGVRTRHLAIDPVFARRPQRPPTIDAYHAELAAVVRAQGGSTG